MSMVAIEDPDGTTVLRISRQELVEILLEEKRLRKQVTELQQDNTRLVEDRRTVDMDGCVRNLMDLMGQATPDVPAVPSENIVRLRLRLITEEYLETVRAVLDDSAVVSPDSLDAAEQILGSLVDCCAVNLDMPKFIDGLADLDVMVSGTRVAFGVDGRPIARAVDAANRAKVGGGKREDGKFLKPPGWTPPDIEGELRKQGWTG